MATKGWADVQLLVASQCVGNRRTGSLSGQGLSYFSVDDYLTFQGFWPWSEDAHFRQIVYDASGMISSVRPCPHALTPDQIRSMQVVAHEALIKARTSGEKRMLTRVTQRLLAVGSTPLASGQGGCTDAPADDRGPVRRKDFWTNP
jgi:hypothetical protein